jgi:hypothetical protein
VVTWGENSAGQLGNNTTNESWVPVPTSNLGEADEIAACELHSLASGAP